METCYAHWIAERNTFYCLTIGLLCFNPLLGALALHHANDNVIEPRDDFAFAHNELEGLPLMGAVKHCVIIQRPPVVNLHMDAQRILKL